MAESFSFATGNFGHVGGKPDHGLTVFDLFEAAERMIEARLRRENPAVTPTRVRAAIDEWASGGDRHLDADGYLREIPVPSLLQ